MPELYCPNCGSNDLADYENFTGGEPEKICWDCDAQFKEVSALTLDPPSYGTDTTAFVIDIFDYIDLERLNEKLDEIRSDRKLEGLAVDIKYETVLVLKDGTVFIRANHSIDML